MSNTKIKLNTVSELLNTAYDEDLCDTTIRFLEEKEIELQGYYEEEIIEQMQDRVIDWIMPQVNDTIELMNGIKYKIVQTYCGYSGEYIYCLKDVDGEQRDMTLTMSIDFD